MNRIVTSPFSWLTVCAKLLGGLRVEVAGGLVEDQDAAAA